MEELNFTYFPKTSTKRLNLRKLTIKDKEVIYVLHKENLVIRYLGKQELHSVFDAVKFIETINQEISKNKEIIWGLALKNSNDLIGFIRLFNIECLGEIKELIADIEIRILPNYQQQGFATEALKSILECCFYDFKFWKIFAYTVENNIAAIRTLEKNNFKPELWQIEPIIDEQRKLWRYEIYHPNYGYLRRKN